MSSATTSPGRLEHPRVPALEPPPPGPRPALRSPAGPAGSGGPGHRPAGPSRGQPARHPRGVAPAPPRTPTSCCSWNPTGTAWEPSSATCCGPSAAPTTCGPRAWWWSTTPTCPSTSRRIRRGRRSSRSGTRPGRSSGSGWTPWSRRRNRNAPSSIGTTTGWWRPASGAASHGRERCDTPVERVLAIGTPRTDPAPRRGRDGRARARIVAAHPELAGRRVVLWAPTFRGRGRARTGAMGLDGRRLRALLPVEGLGARDEDPSQRRPRPSSRPRASTWWAVRPRTSTTGWPRPTCCSPTTARRSSSGRCFAGRWSCWSSDLEAYEQDPGLYLDYRTDLVGTQVRDTDAAASAILEGHGGRRGMGRVHRRQRGRLRRARGRAVRGAVPARA